MRQVGRIAATELQRQRMFFSAEVQMPWHVAMQQRTGGHHLGVQPRSSRQLAMEVAAMAVGPVHQICIAKR